MDTVKEEPDPKAETRSRPSSHGDQADVKPEHLPEPFSFVEVKQELVCIVRSLKKKNTSFYRVSLSLAALLHRSLHQLGHSVTAAMRTDAIKVRLYLKSTQRVIWDLLFMNE